MEIFMVQIHYSPTIDLLKKKKKKAKETIGNTL
jgi:hypothetical protein